MEDFYNELPSLMLDTLLSMGFDFDTAFNALLETGCSSIEAALDYAWDKSADDTSSHTAPSNTQIQPPEPPAMPPQVSAYFKEQENLYEGIEKPIYSHNSSSEEWEKIEIPIISCTSSSEDWESSDEEYHEFHEMMKDTAEYITERNQKDTEHIKLISDESEDVFTHTTLMEHIVSSLNEISEICGICKNDAIKLLRNYRWNQEQLTERYFENLETVLIQLSDLSQAPPHMEIAECVIYWLDWLKPVISEPMMDKFTKFWVNAFVQVNPVWKRCPRPDCDFLLRVQGVRELRCRCGYISCPSCPREGHEPASCDHMAQWEAKNEVEVWIKLHTQYCPHCKCPIEKNNGDNAMTCLKCYHRFCWICLGDEEAHGDDWLYMWEGNTPKCWDNPEAMKERESLEDYLQHYHPRYQVHEQALTIEKDFRQQALEQYITMYEPAINTKAIELISEAAENLSECRRVLKYTYVKAFFMEENNAKHRLENLQADLESATEALSQLFADQLGCVLLDDLRVKSNTATSCLLSLMDAASSMTGFQEEQKNG